MQLLRPFLMTQFKRTVGESTDNLKGTEKTDYLVKVNALLVCFRDSLQAQPLDVVLPIHWELTHFKLWTRACESVLFLCMLSISVAGQRYSMTRNWTTCQHFILTRDVNHIRVEEFDEFWHIFGLINHVDFASHLSRSLVLVIIDLAETLSHVRTSTAAYKHWHRDWQRWCSNTTHLPLGSGWLTRFVSL